MSRFSVVTIKFKTVGKGWGSNPYLPLQNPVVLPTVPWEPLEFLTNVGEKMKKKLARQKLEPGPTASEPRCLTPCAMGTIGMEFLTNFCEIIKIFGTAETRTRTVASEPCCPNPAAVIYFQVKKVGNLTRKLTEKKKNDPTK